MEKHYERNIMKTDVIIVGAGPTGLSLACQLIRYGVNFIVIEKNEGITHLSKALGVQARSLEIYEQLELAKEAVDRGAIASQVQLIVGGKVGGGFNLSNMGKNFSPYPYMLVLEQSKNEQLLYEYIQKHDQEVLWNTTSESFFQDDTCVRAIVKNGNNQPQIIEAKYLVGCDGARSFVRNSLGLSFEGSTFEQLFYVADVQIEGELDRDAINICLGRYSFVGLFPMEADKSWRIVGNLPELRNLPKQAPQSQAEVDWEKIEQKIKTETRLPLEITKVNWFSTYRVHTRRVDRFALDRCFLAGDAAHIHTPAGGQGMNTGIQDTYNLAWKLGFVLKGYADRSLLDTYNEERLENAKNLLETTDRLFEFQTGSNWLISLIRMTIFPPLAKYLFSLDLVQKSMFSLLSQIGISYRHSRLSHHFGDEKFKVKAGDRMPYLSIKDKSIYDKLHQPKFHLLAFLAEKSDDRTLKEKINHQCDRWIDYHTFPLSPNVSEVFGVDRSFTVMLRPDNHIGFICQEISPDLLQHYLVNVIKKV